MQTNATLHDAGMYMNDIILILTFFWSTFIYKTFYYELPFEKYRVCKIKTFAAIGKIDEGMKGGFNPPMLVSDPKSGAGSGFKRYRNIDIFVQELLTEF
jgi:hypothetical protein